MTPVEVEVRQDAKMLAELARAVPTAVRGRRARSWLWRAALAFAPSPGLLVAFDLPIVAVVWTTVMILIGLLLFAVEREVPTIALGPGRITLDEYGVTIEREDRRERWRSAEILDVLALADTVVLMSHQDGWLVIPRESFDSPAASERFVAAARASVQVAERAPGWPSRPPIQFGVVAFLLACAAGLWWLAWDASFWQRLPSAALAGICVVLAMADMSAAATHRLGNRQVGRPTPPRPGSEGTSESWIAAVRLEQSRPSGSLVFGVYVLAAALLYVTMIAGTIGTIGCVAVVLVLLAFATFELSTVLEMWWPSLPVRSWRQLEATSHGIVRRHAGGSVTVAWSKLADPVVKTDSIGLRWPGGRVFEDIPYSAFATPEEKDAFVAVARTHGAG